MIHQLQRTLGKRKRPAPQPTAGTNPGEVDPVVDDAVLGPSGYVPPNRHKRKKVRPQGFALDSNNSITSRELDPVSALDDTVQEVSDNELQNDSDGEEYADSECSEFEQLMSCIEDNDSDKENSDTDLNTSNLNCASSKCNDTNTVVC